MSWTTELKRTYEEMSLIYGITFDCDVTIYVTLYKADPGDRTTPPADAYISLDNFEITNLKFYAMEDVEIILSEEAIPRADSIINSKLQEPEEYENLLEEAKENRASFEESYE